MRPARLRGLEYGTHGIVSRPISLHSEIQWLRTVYCLRVTRLCPAFSQARLAALSDPAPSVHGDPTRRSPMPIQFKDYYQTLGVPRTASADEIRKSFRKLARQYHPDVAKNKTEAEAKFKEINEAYEVLGDQEKRKKYDELGPNWKQGAEFRPPPGWQGSPFQSYEGGRPGGTEFHFGGTGFSDFFSEIFGNRPGHEAGVGSRFDENGQFAGRGEDLESDILVTLQEALHGAVRPIGLQRRVPCPKCRGTGRDGRKTCPACDGETVTVKNETYQVRIPAGVRDGQQLRLAGRGDPGVGRGAAGDLFLRVRFERHPDFRVEGNDLYCDLDIAPWEAVLGGQVPVPTLEGQVSIKIPPGAQAGQRFRVRGHGLATKERGRGDLYAVLRVQTPSSVSEPEKKIWEQLAAESKFRPRE